MTTPQPHTGAPRRRPSSLQAVLLVVQREFMTRVRKKSFIILTILIILHITKQILLDLLE